MFYAYVIKSQSSGKIYIGQTENLENRLRRHNGEIFVKKTSYTKLNKGPWVLVYKEEYSTRLEAMQREKFLKSHVGRELVKNKLDYK